MTQVQFVEVKPFVSCAKDLEVVYHIPSSIRTSGKHYVALYEVGETNSEQFTWVWAGKTVPLEQEKNGLTVKWQKGKVVFRSHVLPKLSDGREHFFMYCNEDGTSLGTSRPFQFCTDSDQFSSIDLQSVPSEDVVVVNMHLNKAPSTSSSEISLHSTGSMSFEVLSEQRYGDTIEPNAGDKEKKNMEDVEYYNESVTSTVVPQTINSSQSEGFCQSVGATIVTKKVGTFQSTATGLPTNGQDRESDKQKSSSDVTGSYQNGPMESEEVINWKYKVATLESEVTRKDNIIEELQTEVTTLKGQSALSNSTVLINPSPKDDKEKRILIKRIQDETKKSTRLEEVLHHKEAQLERLRNIVLDLNIQVKENVEKCSKLLIEKSEVEQKLQQIEEYKKEPEPLQVEVIETQQNKEMLTINRPLTENEITNLNKSVGADYKTKLYITMFNQDPFVCHICNEVLPAHTQEFTRLNHIQQCKRKTS